VAGVSYDGLQNKQSELIRKTLDGSVFIAPTSADPIDTLTDPSDKLLAMLPDGYEDLGLCTDDGAQFSRDVDTSDITSWGRVEPTRSDITADTTSLEIACQELKKATLGLHTGADLTNVTPDAESGEVVIDKPARPAARYYRILALGVDLTDDGELYAARFLPRAKVTDYSDFNMQSSDDEALTFGATLTSHFDSGIGCSERWLFGGPGWYALLSKMGFSTSGS